MIRLIIERERENVFLGELVLETWESYEWSTVSCEISMWIYISPLRPLDRGQSLLLGSEMLECVLKYWVLYSSVLSNLTPKGNNRAKVPDVLSLQTCRCSAVPPAPGLSDSLFPFCCPVLNCSMKVKFPSRLVLVHSAPVVIFGEEYRLWRSH